MYPFINPHKVKVAYNGLSQAFIQVAYSIATASTPESFFLSQRPILTKKIKELSSTNLSYKQYFIYFGGHSARKNTHRMYKAYSKLPRAIRSQVPLISVAQRKDLPRRLRQTTQLPEVICIPKQDEQTLAILVSGALASLHPSLYEGFGLPLIESLAVKTYVLPSDIPTNRELLGNEWQTFFNPTSTSSLQQALLHLSQSLSRSPFDPPPTVAKTLQQCTWQQAASVVLSAFDEVLSSKPTHEDDEEQR